MTHSLTPAHPFGTDIRAADLQAIFAPLQQWEDRYRQLILLGKLLPSLPENLRTTQAEIRGCENRVWLDYLSLPEGKLHFYGDSEGRIVRGLLAILLTAVEGKTALELHDADPLALFEQLGLSAQLSASRIDGLTAMVQRVKEIAAAAV